MKKALVISSHLDDGILSAGQFMASRPDCDLLTVFAGIPEDKKLQTPYDKECGFTSSQDAMSVRQKENDEACAILNARPIYLPRFDSQYTKADTYLGLSTELKNYIMLENYEMVLAPLGLRHPDHIAVSNAILKLRLKNCYLYEDLPHRVTHPELVQERLEELKGGWYPTLAFIGAGDIADKVRALWCYKSQIGRGDLNPYNLYVPERFWKV